MVLQTASRMCQDFRSSLQLDHVAPWKGCFIGRSDWVRFVLLRRSGAKGGWRRAARHRCMHGCTRLQEWNILGSIKVVLWSWGNRSCWKCVVNKRVDMYFFPAGMETIRFPLANIENYLRYVATRLSLDEVQTLKLACSIMGSRFYVFSVLTLACRWQFGDDSGSEFDDNDYGLPFPKPLDHSAVLERDLDPSCLFADLFDRHQTLEDLRNELRELSQTLSKELLDLVNDN